MKPGSGSTPLRIRPVSISDTKYRYDLLQVLWKREYEENSKKKKKGNNRVFYLKANVCSVKLKINFLREKFFQIESF